MGGLPSLPRDAEQNCPTWNEVTKWMRLMGSLAVVSRSWSASNSDDECWWRSFLMLRRESRLDRCYLIRLAEPDMNVIHLPSGPSIRDDIRISSADVNSYTS